MPDLSSPIILFSFCKTFSIFLRNTIYTISQSLWNVISLVTIHPFLQEIWRKQVISQTFSPPVTLKIESRSPKFIHFFLSLKIINITMFDHNQLIPSGDMMKTRHFFNMLWPPVAVNMRSRLPKADQIFSVSQQLVSAGVVSSIHPFRGKNGDKAFFQHLTFFDHLWPWKWGQGNQNVLCFGSSKQNICAGLVKIHWYLQVKGYIQDFFQPSLTPCNLDNAVEVRKILPTL